MTDRYFALTVVLDKDYRDDDAGFIIQAIKMVKGVQRVEPHVTEVSDFVNRERLYWDFRAAMDKALNELRPRGIATMD
jgi:hypothetical protein